MCIVAVCDPRAVISTYLVTTVTAALTAMRVKTGTRIYSPRLPIATALQQALTFRVTATETNQYIPEMVDCWVEFHCWGASTADATQVSRLLYDALQGIENAVVGANIIYNAEHNSTQDPIIDPDSVQGEEWWFALSLYTIQVR